MSENNKVKVNIENQPRPYEKLYKIPESAFDDPEFPTYLEAQVWMQDLDNIPVIERYHATVIYNTPSYETEFGNIVVNPEYAWRIITDGFGGTDIVTYKTKPQTAKQIIWTTWTTSSDPEDLIITVLYNNTGRTLSWNDTISGFVLSGDYTENYTCQLLMAYGDDVPQYFKFGITESEIGLGIGPGLAGISGTTGVEEFALTGKIEIYE